MTRRPNGGAEAPGCVAVGEHDDQVGPGAKRGSGIKAGAHVRATAAFKADRTKVANSLRLDVQARRRR